MTYSVSGCLGEPLFFLGPKVRIAVYLTSCGPAAFGFSKVHFRQVPLDVRRGISRKSIFLLVQQPKHPKRDALWVSGGSRIDNYVMMRGGAGLFGLFIGGADFKQGSTGFPESTNLRGRRIELAEGVVLKPAGAATARWSCLHPALRLPQ